ncbi:MAG: TraV family lipoprotein [bacterium]|nr:TraV family lipoprotein [bacterium]
MKKHLIHFALLLSLSACSQAISDLANPYHGGDPEVELGERSNKAILEDNGEQGSADERARHAFEVMKQYERAQTPQPYKPVLNPAVVRMMWIPDHLNKNGDLVPSHYYFLKVRDDRWAVQDAFEMEEQLDQKSGGAGGATPWVYGDK